MSIYREFQARVANSIFEIGNFSKFEYIVGIISRKSALFSSSSSEYYFLNYDRRT